MFINVFIEWINIFEDICIKDRGDNLMKFDCLFVIGYVLGFNLLLLMWNLLNLGEKILI